MKFLQGLSGLRHTLAGFSDYPQILGFKCYSSVEGLSGRETHTARTARSTPGHLGLQTRGFRSRNRGLLFSAAPNTDITGYGPLSTTFKSGSILWANCICSAPHKRAERQASFETRIWTESGKHSLVGDSLSFCDGRQFHTTHCIGCKDDESQEPKKSPEHSQEPRENIYTIPNYLTVGRFFISPVLGEWTPISSLYIHVYSFCNICNLDSFGPSYNSKNQLTPLSGEVFISFMTLSSLVSLGVMV